MVDDAYELHPERLEIDGARLHSRRPRRVSDTYHDTHDLRLARWGVTLRWREGDGWTVKIPRRSRGGEVLDRDEIAVPGEPGTVPPAAIDLVVPFTRGAPLERVADLRTARVVRVWRDLDGGVVGELVDDRVVGDRRGEEVTFRELEFELAEGVDDDVLDHVADRLGLVGDATPKLVRVLGKRAAAPADVALPELGGKPTGADVIHRAIAGSVRHLLLHLPSARIGERPRGVHQSRVATRRLRSDLATFTPLLDQAWAKDLRGELRWLASELGHVRDADVLDARLSTALAEDDAFPTAAGVEIRARLASQRVRDRGALLVHLADERAIELYDHLVAAAAEPRTRGRADKKATNVLPPLVAKSWRDLRRGVRALPSEPSDSELHEIRSLAKRVRYAAEAVAPALGKDARRFAKSAARIQTTLGERNDDAVAAAWLERAAADGLGSQAAFVAGRLAERFGAGDPVDRDAWRAHYDDMRRRSDWLD